MAMNQMSLNELARRAERMADSLQQRHGVSGDGAPGQVGALSSGILDSADIRPIARNIRQMREAGARLSNRLQQSTGLIAGLGSENISPLSEEAGIRFLARAGVDVRTLTADSSEKLRNKLAESSVQGHGAEESMAMQDDSVSYCDIKGWIDKSESMMISSILEETRRKTSQQCMERYWNVMESEQNRLKRKLKETLTATLSMPAAASVIGTPGGGYNPLADVSILASSTNAAIYHNRLDSDYSKIVSSFVVLFRHYSSPFYLDCRLYDWSYSIETRH